MDEQSSLLMMLIKILTFFIRISNFSLSLNVLLFSIFSLMLLLNFESVTTSENERIIFKALLMFYFIIKHYRDGAEQQILHRWGKR